MGRPYKPAVLYMTPLPVQPALLSTPPCPLCGSDAIPVGMVADKVICRCGKCGVKFKPYPRARLHAWDN